MNKDFQYYVDELKKVEVISQDNYIKILNIFNTFDTGWWLTPITIRLFFDHFDSRVLNKMNNIEDISKIIEDTYIKVFEEGFGEWIYSISRLGVLTKKSEERKVFAESVWAFWHKKYYLSIGVTIPLIESLLQNFLINIGYKNRINVRAIGQTVNVLAKNELNSMVNRKGLCSELLERKLKEVTHINLKLFFKNMVDTVWHDFDPPLMLNTKDLNRHAIAHGRYGYGIQINAIKAFLSFEMACWSIIFLSSYPDHIIINLLIYIMTL
ncbi:hypothetical protein [Thermoanaerobacterium sp. DL9XJH110]|uniref:hypothetical protein n=1 Tax=Thermoanaerobacterium sp. DL9XJH110 TaxID=3386643 RepID=UPI003BB51A5E